MLGRYSMADNARVVLANSINSVATTITFNAAVAPFNNPANPTGDAASGGLGIATITDSLTQPTKFEIVTYTTLTNNGDGTLSLGGVSRGAAGSTAQSWTAGAVIYQALTADGLLHPFLSMDQVTSGGAMNVSAHLNVTGGKFGTWPAALGTGYSRVHASGFESSNGNIGGRSWFFGNTSFFAGANSESEGSITALVGANSTDGPRLALAKGRGTDGLTAVQVGDELGSIRWYARHASSGWAQPARIVSTVTSISGSAVKSDVAVQISVDGTSAPSNVLYMQHNGISFSSLFSGDLSVSGQFIATGNATIFGDVDASGGTANFRDVIVSRKLTNGWSHTLPTLSAMTAPTGSVNNAAMPSTLTGAIRFTGTGGGTWTGLTGGAAGRRVTLINASSGSVTLANESGSSTAANRFALPASTHVIAANDSATLWYDGASSRWRVLK